MNIVLNATNNGIDSSGTALEEHTGKLLPLHKKKKKERTASPSMATTASIIHTSKYPRINAIFET